MKYNHKKIESYWQEKWKRDGLYKTSEDKKKPKYYVLDMFPYPSGAGLHVGHPKGYIATDIFARMKSMQGYNVLHPMGWDAFGLPAENFALKNKVHPKISTNKNIATFKKQLGKLGFSYDWSREINTTDPKFYKWTQWIFLKLLEKGLAYESHEPINWCPSCKTGLANEDLEDGKCERCGSEIEQKPMRQWVLKITDYADRMLQDLEKLEDWDDSIKEMQKNWIGKSIGAEVDFKINGDKITVFTTRPDTLFGATYFVLAPEHSLIENYKLSITNYEEVKKYVKQAKNKTELERTELQKEKTGVKLEGIWAINPVNNEKIPVFIADYVMMGYGTGAIMAVPAHDERDYEFAERYDLPIKNVVAEYYPPHKEMENVQIRKDKPTIKRNNIICIIKHWEEDKYIMLDWENQGWFSFVVGGIKKGETINQAASRELEEETGYKNYKIIRELGEEIHSDFFAAHKDVNRYGIFKAVYVELQDGEKNEISKEEKEKHKIIWTDKKTIEEKIVFKNHINFWHRLNNSARNLNTENGISVNSEFLNGLKTFEAKDKIINWLEEKKLGKKAVNYKLKDWVFSRQRYWGEPIPVIHCEKCGVVGVPESDLPVELPEVEHYEPSDTGESPLATIEDWVSIKCPKCGEPGKRETNTMPQWAGSSWYYLRFIDSENNKALVDKSKDKYWSPVDFYVGGAEHATRHLIYARFWHKFLYDIGVVNYDEPFKRLQHVGLIMAEDGRKMSKRWGNVINPDEIVESHGADAMRVYEMFMGPFSQSCAWSENGLTGARKFLEKVWKIKSKINNKSKNNLDNIVHKTIKKVGEDIEGFKFNTAVSAMMILVNEMEKEKEVSEEDYKKFLIILAPFAPHMTEELWSSLNNKESIFEQEWPEFNPKLIKDENIKLVVQVNGKLRDTIEVPADISEKEAKKIAPESEKVKKWIDKKEIIKIIFVKGKLVNIVVK